jgi:hypothetical protein
VDRDEGAARHIVLGINNTPVNFGGSWHNPIYILCLSSGSVDRDYLKSKYGSHLIVLEDIHGFVRNLAAAITSSPLPQRELLGIEVATVRYNRDEILSPEPNQVERHRLMWAQKAQCFGDDCEVRVAVFMSGPVAGAPAHWTIECVAPAARSVTATSNEVL